MSKVVASVLRSTRMRRMIMKIAASSAVAVVMAAPLGAQTIAYNFSWIGTGGYSMSGNFTFAVESAGDGSVRDGEVRSLTFEGFLNGVSLGSNSRAQTQDGFNFNFNARTEQFYLGGTSFGDEGQTWNSAGTGLGFAAGSFASTLTLEGSSVGFIENPVPLVATRVAVPEPSTLTLLTFALGALSVASRRRKRSLI